MTQAEKAAAFAALHAGEPFVIPNPWDVGTARVLAAARLRGAGDHELRLRLHARPGRRRGDARRGGRARPRRSTPRPICRSRSTSRTATAPLPRSRARAIEAVAAVGAVGGSIEDWEGRRAIYELGHAAERVAAAAEVARELPFPFMLTARAENHIRGNPDLDDTIARLRAYEEAGADVLYAPGLPTPAQIAAVIAAVGKPVNVLALAEPLGRGDRRRGRARISVGGSLAWAAVEAMADAGRSRIRDSGRPVGSRRARAARRMVRLTEPVAEATSRAPGPTTRGRRASSPARRGVPRRSASPSAGPAG